jgi:hypothetical protein
LKRRVKASWHAAMSKRRTPWTFVAGNQPAALQRSIVRVETLNTRATPFLFVQDGSDVTVTIDPGSLGGDAQASLGRLDVLFTPFAAGTGLGGRVVRLRSEKLPDRI